jgi:pyruvate dehydrogenase E2 component (dihydrolipoamide acetyltransferase)
MATEVRLPQFGMGMQEGKLLRWFKHEGEKVEEGEPICEVETEKATVEVPAPQSGLLTRILVQVDRTVPVLEVLALIESPGEVSSSTLPASKLALATTAPTSAAPQPPARALQPRPMDSSHIQVTPLARRVAKEHGINLHEVRGTGPGGRITDQDVRRTIADPMQTSPQASPTTESRASTIHESRSLQVEPRARRLANQHGIDLQAVNGSGPGGRIMEEDVQRVLDGRGDHGKTAPPVSGTASTGEDRNVAGGQQRVIPLTGMRGVIARRMLQSLQTSAQLTLISEADITDLVKQRKSLAEQFDLTYTNVLIRAAALALKKNPRLNATIVGDEIHILPEIHVGVAVALDDGLVVPVVRNADRKTLNTIAQEVAEFAQRARSGKLMMAEITGGTFTVTNLGSFGIDAFTPILNPPEAAILGVGRIVERLTRRDSDLVWRQMIVLSLTVDHRVVDGAPAALFLQTLRESLEHPDVLIQ